MFRHFAVTLIVLIFVGTLRAEAPTTASDMPNFKSMDRDVLALMCEQLWKRVQSLEQQVASLEAKLVEDAGGETSGTVDGGLVAVDRGSWTVTVNGNPEPDVSALEARREVARADVTAYGPDVAAAQKAVNAVMSKGPYNSKNNSRGYKPAERASAERALKNVQRKVKGAEMRINQLNRQIEVERSSRVITGSTDDGLAVKIIARGVTGPIGAGMRVGQTYTVTGRGSVAGGVVTIQLQTATPTQAVVPPG